MDSVKCPHCGKQVELSEAIVHELQAQVREEENKKLKAQFEARRAKEEADHEKRLKLEFEKQNKLRQEELEKSQRKEEELSLKLVREREEREKAEAKIRADAVKNAQEDQALKIKEKDIQVEQIRKIADDLRRANEDLKRKLEQGSQQMQGEALELDVEEKLRKAFPTDEFLPIPKGVEGADIWQKVVNKDGKIVGSIVWELKRTKSWSNNWPLKLREDMRKIGASQAILVSDVLPKEIENFDRKEGIFMCGFTTYMGTASLVRVLLLSVSAVKSASGKKDEELEQIRDYIMSDQFLHKIQAHFDNVEKLRKLHDQEKRSASIRWKSVESYLGKLDMNTSEFYAELQGIVPNLPTLNELEPGLLLAESDDEDSNQTLF